MILSSRVIKISARRSSRRKYFSKNSGQLELVLFGLKFHMSFVEQQARWGAVKSVSKKRRSTWLSRCVFQDNSWSSARQIISLLRNINSHCNTYKTQNECCRGSLRLTCWQMARISFRRFVKRFRHLAWNIFASPLHISFSRNVNGNTALSSIFDQSFDGLPCRYFRTMVRS